MKRALTILNVVAALVIVIWGAHKFVAPLVAEAFYQGEYKEKMFHCDQAMREHFIAKQMVVAATTEETIRNLEAAEIGLTECHHYDSLRKKMMRWGMSEADLASIDLEAVEERARDIRKFVETHELRY